MNRMRKAYSQITPSARLADTLIDDFDQQQQKRNPPIPSYAWAAVIAVVAALIVVPPALREDADPDAAAVVLPSVAQVGAGHLTSRTTALAGLSISHAELTKTLPVLAGGSITGLRPIPSQKVSTIEETKL